MALCAVMAARARLNDSDSMETRWSVVKPAVRLGKVRAALSEDGGLGAGPASGPLRALVSFAPDTAGPGFTPDFREGGLGPAMFEFLHLAIDALLFGHGLAYDLGYNESSVASLFNDLDPTPTRGAVVGRCAVFRETRALPQGQNAR